MKKKCAIYNRYSTEVQKERLENTKEKLIKYCKEILNIDDYVIFEEIASVNDKRNKFNEMIARIHKNEFTDLLVNDFRRIAYPKEKFKPIVLDICGYVDNIHSYSESYNITDI